jgi:homocysteine S-methyltransferase
VRTNIRHPHPSDTTADPRCERELGGLVHSAAIFGRGGPQQCRCVGFARTSDLDATFHVGVELSQVAESCDDEPPSREPLQMSLMSVLATGRVLVTDGAMGTELERRGAAMDLDCWSALALESSPDLVTAIHDDYLSAGADIHLTHTFPLARHTLDVIGRGDDVPRLNRLAARLCLEALERVDDDRERWVAGSVSNYRSAGDRSPLLHSAGLRASFEEQVELLTEAGVDLIALEMLSDVEVSRKAIDVALGTDLPVIIGVTCEWGPDGRTIVTRGHDMGLQASPTALDDLLPELLDGIDSSDDRVVLAVMHCELDVTGPALDIVSARWPGVLAAYPNSGEIIPPNWQFDTVCTPSDYVAAAVDWIDRGESIVGGCCGIGPAHIAALTERLGS